MTACLAPSDAEGLLFGTLDGAARRRVESHLRACPRCRRLVDELVAGSGAPHVVPADDGGEEDLDLLLGPYRLLREVARGGQGRVYLAEDTRLKRSVAIKVLAAGFDSEGALRRFQREAEALARLDHPGICHVLEASTIDDIPFIAMPWIDGETLSSIIERDVGGLQRLAGHVRRCVHLVERAARALHAAHEAGFVHRDVKPSNIIVRADGRPVVLDFGLARDATSGDEGLTHSDALLGTPAYMAPEQLRGAPATVDARTDVYALGVTLYQCVTGRVPFDAPSREVLYRRILDERPPRPERDGARVPRDLEVILDTALEKDPARRYTSALELAEDLRRLREYEPIRARPPSPLERLHLWTRRQPALASAVAAAFVLLAAGLAVALILLGKVTEERGRKEDALAETRAALRRADGLRLAAQSAAALPHDPALALILATESGKREQGLLARNAAAAALEALRELRTLVGHGHGVASARWHPDNARVVTASYDGTAAIWDAMSGERLAVLAGHEGVVIDARWSPDGERVLTASWDGTARVWSASEASCVRVLAASRRAATNVASYAADGARIVTASGDGEVIVWNAASGARLLELLVASEPVFAADLGPGGAYTIATGRRSVHVWDARGEFLWEEVFADAPGVRLLPSSDTRRVIGVTPAEVFRIDASNGLWSVRAACPDAVFTSFAASADGELVVLTSGDGRLHRLDAAGLTSIAVGAAVPARFALLAVSPDNTRVLASVEGKRGLVVSSRSGRLVAELRGHTESIVAGAFSSDGARVVTASLDGTARVWRASTGPLPESRVGLALQRRSRDGRTSVSVASDRHVEVLDTRSDLATRIIDVVDGVAGVAIDITGARVAIADRTHAIRVFDSRTSEELRHVPPDAVGQQRSLALSPGGAVLALGAADGRLQLLEVDSGKTTAAFRPHADRIALVEYTDDGRRLATGAGDRRVRVWDVATLTRVAEIDLGRDSPVALRFAPDASLLAIATREGSVHAFEVATAREWLAVAALSADGGAVVDFSRDGRSLVVAAGGVEKTWPLDPLAAGAGLLPRAPTGAEAQLYELDHRDEFASERAGGTPTR